MVITTLAGYNQKITELETKYNKFLTEYARLKNMPCGVENSISTGLGQSCLDDIWNKSGCDKKPSPYTVTNNYDNTLYDTIDDAYKWASFSDSAHPKNGCYTNATATAKTTKDYNINNITMTTLPKSAFSKNGVGITAPTINDCKEKCLPETGCISATYNSSSKKCWTNMGSMTEWKEPLISTDMNDTAIYYENIQLVNQLIALNQELQDYENKIATTQNTGTGTSSVTRTTSNTGSSSNTGSTSSQPPPNFLEGVLQMAPTILSSIFGQNSTEEEIDPKDFAALKKKVGVIDTDRIQTAKTLELYKQQLLEMSKKQEDSNAELKKQIITIMIIVVIGILLIFILSAIMQSFNSSNSNGFMGGGKSSCGSFPFSLKPIMNFFTNNKK
jgi:hypothetical protein